MDWEQLGIDAYSAANTLIPAKRWRSVVSRAYYAAYSKVTHQLVAAGVQMPKGRLGPHHDGKKGIAILALTHLTHLNQAQRTGVSGKLMVLYNLRLIADYRPDGQVGQPDATAAISLMATIFKLV